MKKIFFVIITGLAVTLASCGQFDPNKNIDEGKVEGKLEGKIETAKSAKQMGLKVEDIIKLTGLTKEEIEKL